MSTIDPADVLFPKTRKLVLGLLYGHADESFYLREIVRRTGQSPGAVLRELDLLTRADLLTRSSRGNQVFFEANRKSPIYRELQGLVLKTVAVVGVLRDVLREFADRIVVAFVFGSAARQELRKGSDVDLLVVSDVPFDEIVHALRPAQSRIGREVNPTVYPRDEFIAKLRTDNHFIRSVLDEPRTYVYGDDRELERLEAERLARRAHDKQARDPRLARSGRARSGRQRSKGAQR